MGGPDPAGARRREQCLQVIAVGQRERLLVRERRSEPPRLR